MPLGDGGKPNSGLNGGQGINKAYVKEKQKSAAAWIEQLAQRVTIVAHSTLWLTERPFAGNKQRNRAHRVISDHRAQLPAMQGDAKLR